MFAIQGMRTSGSYANKYTHTHTIFFDLPYFYAVLLAKVMELFACRLNTLIHNLYDLLSTPSPQRLFIYTMFHALGY